MGCVTNQYKNVVDIDYYYYELVYPIGINIFPIGYSLFPIAYLLLPSGSYSGVNRVEFRHRERFVIREDDVSSTQ